MDEQPRIVTEFPHRVREIENCWIPMSDGCRLAARIWLPEDADRRPVPAIIESIPYRKRDVMRLRDEPMHRYFAGYGYAALRIDLRGSGDSDGVLDDEYSDREHDDGVEAIRWVAEQPWCSGAVGMMGKSWGGFNSLQIAARRPPALKAILAACASDDRYADDVHYMGGCLLNENLLWGAILLALNARPPDPLIVGDAWRDTWLARLRASRLFPELWMRHPLRDAYWKRGSVCEDYSAIACPTYLVSGWADAYSNAVPRSLAGLTCERKGLVGPWAHVYPHEGVPSPAIGFLQEALRWWDQWLKGVDTGIRDEPLYRAWMQESVPPRAFHAERPGRWIAEHAWPSPHVRALRFQLGELRLLLGHGERASAPLTIRSPESTGSAAGSWCGFGVEGDTAGEQREDDARSLCFDSEPLPEHIEILGSPILRLSFEADRPRALVAARLCELASNGSSALVTYGLRNLAHGADHERAQALVPGRRTVVELRLNDIAHAFPAGARIRLALSTSYWPIAWPAPEPVTLSVFPEECSLELPLRSPGERDRGLRPFEPPETAPLPAYFDIHPGGAERSLQRDEHTGEIVQTIAIDLDETGGPALTRLDDIALEHGHSMVERFSIRDGDPLSARAEVQHEALFRRAGWSTRIRTRAELTGTREEFHLRAELEAFEGERFVFERTWERRIPRGLL